MNKNANIEDLSVTFHNASKEYLKSVKIKFKTKLESLQLPMKWDEFNDYVDKYKVECLKDLTSNIKDDKDFQKEYKDDYSNFVDDKIYIFELSNSRLLEDLHKGILRSLTDQILENIKTKFYENQKYKLEEDLNQILDSYKVIGIESPEKEKVLN